MHANLSLNHVRELEGLRLPGELGQISYCSKAHKHMSIISMYWSNLVH